MEKFTFADIKNIYKRFQDPEEKSVKYIRSYNTVYDWLTGVPPNRGLGFDKEYVIRLMASVAEKVAVGSLSFDSGQEFDTYLKDRCQTYVELGQKRGQRLLNRLAISELNKIRKTERRWKWLSIILLLLLTGSSTALLLILLK